MGCDRLKAFFFFRKGENRKSREPLCLWLARQAFQHVNELDFRWSSISSCSRFPEILRIIAWQGCRLGYSTPQLHWPICKYIHFLFPIVFGWPGKLFHWCLSVADRLHSLLVYRTLSGNELTELPSGTFDSLSALLNLYARHLWSFADLCCCSSTRVLSL